MSTSAALVFSGGGTFFFWYAGVASFLSKNTNLKNTTFVGVSAGALIAVLLACEVDILKSVEMVVDICKNHNVHNRMFGILGIWSCLVKQWLSLVLPSNAADLCNSKTVCIILKRFPNSIISVSKFKSKDDIIECLLAAVHIPLLMNMRFLASYNNAYFYDPYVSGMTNLETVLKTDKTLYYFDYATDEIVMGLFSKNRFSTLRTISRESVKLMFDCGFDFAKTLVERGRLCFLTEQYEK